MTSFSQKTSTLSLFSFTSVRENQSYWFVIKSRLILSGVDVSLGWFIIAHIFSMLLEFISIGRLSEREKDIEILILRHQLDILERKQKTPIKPNRAEKMTLAVLTNKLKQISNRSTHQLRDALRIFQPATV